MGKEESMEKERRNQILEMQEMKKQLNCMVVENKDYQEIYDISVKLDQLIMAYYDKKLKKTV